MNRKMKPVYFKQEEMIQAILDGDKTVFRRVVDPQPIGKMEPMPMAFEWPNYWRDQSTERVYAPPYHPGDVLYIRETWDREPVTQGGHLWPGGVWYYKADGDLRPEAWRGNWRSSTTMPREAARLFLHIQSVRAERLQDMTAESCARDGGYEIEAVKFLGVESLFPYRWNSTIKPEDMSRFGWSFNPWVWVFEFESISKEAANEIINGGSR